MLRARTLALPAKAVETDAYLHAIRARPRYSPNADVCIPWAVKRQEIPSIPGDVELAERIWCEIDSLASTFIWQLLVSF